MFIRYFFLFFLFPFIGKGQFIDSTAENYKAYYYDNGQLSSEGFLISGKPNGYWITYYPNQLRKSEGNRRNFLLDSVWNFYDEEGNIEHKITYEKGKKSGEYLYFDDQCLVVAKENYSKDKKEGISFEYFADTTDLSKRIKKTTPFTNGREDGLGYEYEVDGRLITITTYKKGFLVSSEKINRKDNNGLKQGVWKSYFANKRLEKEERYKNDLLNGYVKVYNKQGKLETAILYINGVEQSKEDNLADFDIETEFHSNGAVKSNITYNLAGKKDGIANYFDEDGNVSSSEFYKNGFLLEKGLIDNEGLNQGMWETYYLDGSVKTKGAYKDSEKFGKWEYYFTNGTLEQIGFYDENGKYTGEWKWYYEDGSLLRKEEYRRGVEDGYLEEYARDGKIITKGEYFDGEKEGEWFYELNDHKEKGKYRYGQRNGYWEENFPNGKKSFEGSYVDGAPEGKHEYYNEEGALIREENYSYGKKDGKWKWYDSFGIEIMTITYDDGEEKKINGQRLKFTNN
jgi:antitoxin component YwqK of YwqJK toxin-antitoxin module